MTMWKKVDEYNLVHKDGHSIELLDGSWAVPFNINPNFSNDLHPFSAAKLLREGLAFASYSHEDNVLPIGMVVHQSMPKRNGHLDQSGGVWNKLLNNSLV